MQFKIRDSSCVHGKRRAGEINFLFLYDYAKSKKTVFQVSGEKNSPCAWKTAKLESNK